MEWFFRNAVQKQAAMHGMGVALVDADKPENSLLMRMCGSRQTGRPYAFILMDPYSGMVTFHTGMENLEEVVRQRAQKVPSWRARPVSACWL